MTLHDSRMEKKVRITTKLVVSFARTLCFTQDEFFSIVHSVLFFEKGGRCLNMSNRDMVDREMETGSLLGH